MKPFEKGHPHEAAAKLPRILLDTDMGNDVDDALALAMLHTLERGGHCKLIGITISKDNPWAAPYTRLVNTRCGRESLPIGCVHGGATPEEGPFIRQISQTSDTALGRPLPRKWPEAVSLARQLLAAQPDQSVTIISIGFFTNLARLLCSAPDTHSPLDGRALIERKVSWVCSMAGNFNPTPEQGGGPDMGNPEFNIRTDVQAARTFIGACPRPIVFSGFEIGAAMRFPCSAILPVLESEPHNPVAAAYAAYLPMPYDRQCWDQTAVLHAVFPMADYFAQSAPGRVNISADGYSTFIPEAQGLHRHLILKDDGARALEAITRLSVEFPRL